MAKRKSKKNLFILIFFICLAVVIIAAVFLGNNNEKSVKVITAKVERKTITQTVTAPGKIEPETQVIISPEISGEIVFLGVNEGDTVKSNELLVRIKPDIIETQLEQSKSAAEAAKMDIEVSKAERDRAKADLERKTKLFEKEYISKLEFDRVSTSFRQAESQYQSALLRHSEFMARYKQILRNAARTTIHSPIDGIITQLSVEKGEKVVGTEMMRGTDMMIVSDLTVMNAVVDVDENEIVSVKVGDSAKVSVHALTDEILYGRVVEIGHSANTTAQGTSEEVTNFQVKIRIIDEDSRLRPGMTCEVDIMTETKYNVLAVPRMAVTVRAKDSDTLDNQNEESQDGITIKKINDKKKKVKERPPTVVFVKQGDIVLKREVKTGVSDYDFMEITSGLKEGEEVVKGSFKALNKELKDSSKIVIDSTIGKVNKEEK